MIGSVAGLMGFVAVWKSKRFDAKSLGALLGAMCGGPVLTAVERYAGNHAPQVEQWYFIGVGIGFFAYAVYAAFWVMLCAVGAVSWRYLSSAVVSRSPDDFEVEDKVSVKSAVAVKS
jgi:hypothetical protein